MHITIYKAKSSSTLHQKNTNMKFAIFGNPNKSKKFENVDTLFDTIRKLGSSFSIDRTFYDFLMHLCPDKLDGADIIDGDDFTADVVISYGGDGTMLRTASRVGSKGYPILGINGGRLGFLTTISHNEIPQTIEDIHNGEYSIEERCLIKAEASGNTLSSDPYALNEIAVMKHDSSSMMKIDVTLDNSDTITYQADGLIVATPSGSTGYSLSVGGPIICPDAAVLVLTPIASHSLGARPIVLNDNTRIEIKADSRSHNFLVAIDGRSESCPDNTILTITKASYKLRLIRSKGSSFVKNLHNKMMWGADFR